MRRSKSTANHTVGKRSEVRTFISLTREDLRIQNLDYQETLLMITTAASHTLCIKGLEPVEG